LSRASDDVLRGFIEFLTERLNKKDLKEAMDYLDNLFFYYNSFFVSEMEDKINEYGHNYDS
jgi:hypothetical protein